MWESILVAVIATVIGTLIVVLLDPPFNWIREKINASRGIHIKIWTRHSPDIDAKLERGPTSREYGFTETAVKVTLMNDTGQRLTIQDIRLMFSSTHGLPVPPEAPVPRSHPTLPAHIESGSAETWYFGAEKVAAFFQMVLDPAAKIEKVRVQPKFTTVTGKVFTGRTIRLSTDVDAYF